MMAVKSFHYLYKRALLMKKRLLDVLSLGLGCLCMALAIVVFFAQHQIAAGGPPGIAIVFNHFTGVSPGLVLLLVNAPLLILGYREYGGPFLLRTLGMVVMTSLLTDLCFGWLSGTVISDDQMLNAIFGGALLGTGIGLMFKGGASSGGWSILARVIATRLKWKVGKVIVGLDSLILVVAVVVFGNIETFLYGVVGVFVSGKMVDLIIIGSTNIKVVHVSCRDAKTLLPLISGELCSPGSVIQCQQLADRGDKELILLSVKQEQVAALSKLIRQAAPDAYMVVSDATEIYGVSAGRAV